MISISIAIVIRKLYLLEIYVCSFLFHQNYLTHTQIISINIKNRIKLMLYTQKYVQTQQSFILMWSRLEICYKTLKKRWVHTSFFFYCNFVETHNLMLYYLHYIFMFSYVLFFDLGDNYDFVENFMWSKNEFFSYRNVMSSNILL